MYRKPSFFVALFAAVAIPAMASAAGPAGTLPAFQSTPLLIPAAQRGAGGGGSAGFTCEGLQCTCQGDVDCNDMFGSGKCGDIASCDDDTGICKCLILKKNPVKKNRPAINGKTPLLKTQ